MKAMFHRCGSGLVWSVAVALSLAATGCTSTYNGQTLPSDKYLDDDLQYFPAGSEFQLSKEAAQIREYQAEAAERGGQGAP